MSTCYRKRPNYVRDWFNTKKAVWKQYIDEKLKEAKAKGLLDNLEPDFKLKTADMEQLKKIGLVGSDGEGSFEDPNSEDGRDINYLAFSSDEENASDEFKGKALGLTYKRNTDSSQNRIDDKQQKYCESVLTKAPDFDKYKKLQDGFKHIIVKHKKDFPSNKMME